MGNVTIRLQTLMQKVAQNGGFRFVPSSFLHNTTYHFYCLNRLLLDLSLKKGMHVGYPMRRYLRYVKVDQVTMYYIGPGNW